MQSKLGWMRSAAKRLLSLGAMLCVGINLSMVLSQTAMANPIYYIYTPNTGAQTQIDVNHSSEWWLNVSNSFSFGGGRLVMKRGSTTLASASVVLSLYRGTDATGTLLATVTRTRSSFTQTFATVAFNFPSVLTLTPGSYYIRLTSNAADQQNRAYFIKGREGSLVSSDGITPISASLANLSLVPISNVATNFLISTPSSALSCSAQNVVVTARNGTNTVTAYDKQITLDTQSGVGTWSLVSGSGVFSQASPGNGIATYTYSTADNGVATFALSYPAAGTSSITLRAFETASSTIQGTFSPLTFYPSGFVLTEAPVPNPPIGVVTGYAKTLTAGNSDTVFITAYGNNTVGSTCGVITGYTGNKSLKFWVSYVNPSSGAGVVPSVNGTAVATSQGTAVARTVTFTNGQASVSFNYRDAGQIRLNAIDDTVPLPVGGISGSTANFVVKPAQFTVNLTGNPAATTASGAVFTSAGSPFSATIQARDSSGNVTPNYGNESSPASVVLYSSNVVLPVGGRNGADNAGTIQNGNAFTKTGPGTFSASNLSFSEVGIFRFTAGVRGGDYLGGGNASGPETGNVGRFTPHNFLVTSNVPALSAASGTFTYVGQNFGFATTPVVTVTARALGGSTTQNYQGDFWRLSTSSLNPVYTSNASLVLNSASPASTIGFQDNQNGTGTYTFGNGTGFVLERPNTAGLVGPINLEMRLASTYTDLDGVSFASNPFVIGGTGTGQGIPFNGGNTFYIGRINVLNATGLNVSGLNLVYRAEYYNGSEFQLNTADSQTNIANPSWIGLSNPMPNTLQTTVTGVSGLVNGEGTISLSAPTPSGVVGTVVVQPNLGSGGANVPWLRSDWTESGTLNQDPSGIANFGALPQEEAQQIIYQNEVIE